MEDGRLRAHQAIIERLGVDGMSSDESDNEAHEPDALNPRYRVLLPKFCARELHHFLAALDRFYIHSRKETNALRGSFPRHRIFDPRSPMFSDKSIYIDGLPINAYDPHWLQERTCINPDKTPYVFTFNPSMFT